MSLFVLLPTLTLCAVPSAQALPMPPPPPGMKLLAPSQRQQRVGAAEAAAEAPAAEDDSDEPEDHSKDSEEMEEMRALEEVTLDPTAKPQGAPLKSLDRLGPGSPLRAALEDNEDEVELRTDAAPPQLPRITDLANFDVNTVAREYDIPVEMQPLVAQFIQFFEGPGRKFFRAWMDRSTRYIPLMTPILEAHGVPRDLVYLSMIESGFSTHAHSWARAVGLWQFMAGTGRHFGLKQDFWVDERRDPVKSTRAAADYLKKLREDLGQWYLAWAGYNAGAGKVIRVMHRKGSSSFWELASGRGLSKETKHYVPKLIAAALIAKNPRAFGFEDAEFDFEEPAQFELVKLVDPTDLEVIAKAAGTTVDAIKDLNPELKRWCTPPATAAHPYLLKLPKGTAAAFAVNYPKVAPRERLTFKVYRVRRGDTLSGIARAYHTAPEPILSLNHLRNPRVLRVNSDLVIPVAPSHGSAAGEVKLASVLEKQVVRARRNGFVAVRPEEEIPAGTRVRSTALGPIKTELVDGKQKVTYGVQSGDSLWSIGERFNCTVADLKRWNHLARRAKLQVGRLLTVWPGDKVPLENRGGTLIAESAPAPVPAEAVASNMSPAAGTVVPASTVIPASSSTSSLPAHRTHTLAAGETLWSVAQKYKVSVDDLRRWNGIKRARSIRAGQMLVLQTP